MGDIYGGAEQCEECNGEYHDTRIYRCSECIYEEYIYHRSDIDGIRNDDIVEEQQNGTRKECYEEHTFECDALILAEVVDEYQRRNGQQVEDMHTDR